MTARLAEAGASGGGIVFLTKNGIGFGHITRCLLLARELRRLAPQVEVTLISQAGSLRAHQRAEVPVINFPLMHRLPSGATEQTHMALLDGVLAELSPSLVVEDTYPDPHYLRIPSIRECRRALVQRRLDCVSFERFRRDGEFAPYDRVLLTQSSSEFDEEDHTAASRLVVARSGKFKFLGPVYRTPTEEELKSTASRYASDGMSIVVVNAGAGGDHFNDAYCERLFASASHIAERFHSERRRVAFVFVLGPYFAGQRPPDLPNVTSVRYEPLLHALFHQARVVVSRPGHNAVHEALAGPASLIAVPGISWMEAQTSYSERLACLPGVGVGDVDDPTGLYELVLRGLSTPPHSEPRVPASAARSTALALLEEHATAAATPAAIASTVFLLVRGADTRRRRTAVRRHVPGACVVTEEAAVLSALLQKPPGGPDSDGAHATAVYCDVPPPPDLRPERLHRHGVGVLLFGDSAEVMRDWVDHHHGVMFAGLLPIELYSLRASGERPREVTARVCRLLRRAPIAALDLDVSGLDDEALDSFLCAVAADLLTPGVRLVGVDELASEHLVQRLEDP